MEAQAAKFTLEKEKLEKGTIEENSSISKQEKLDRDSKLLFHLGFNADAFTETKLGDDEETTKSKQSIRELCKFLSSTALEMLVNPINYFLDH